MPLHQNIDPSSLTDNGRLLTTTELRKILAIESFVASIKEEACEWLLLKNDNTAQLKKLYFQRSIVENPYEYLDQIITPQEKESIEAYRTRVLSELSTCFNLLKSSGSKKFIEELQQKLSAVLITENKEDLYEEYLANLNRLWTIHEESAPDIILANELRDKIADTQKSSDVLDEEDKLLKQKITAFKAENNVDFDLNDLCELVKISKRSSELTYSIIYVKKAGDQQSTAFAVYRGDLGRVLGEGGFGKVKLCQNIKTGEWMAIKTQRNIMKNHSILENTVLENLHRFGGEADRGRKYYTIQKLLPGIDLQKHITQKSSENISERLEIAKQAALLIKEFHQLFLHRDIKPENFIWDKETKTLNLCDFGMACKLNSGQNKILDLSGSGTFLAPEIDASHPGMVPYSIKSDVYALGKTFEILFEGIEGVPEKCTEIIRDMTKIHPDERMNIDEVIAELDTALALSRNNSDLMNTNRTFKEKYKSETDHYLIEEDDKASDYNPFKNSV